VAGVIANVCDIDTRFCHRIGLPKKQFHSIRPGISRTGARVGAVMPLCRDLLWWKRYCWPDLQYQRYRTNLHRGPQGAINRRLHGITQRASVARSAVADSALSPMSGPHVAEMGQRTKNMTKIPIQCRHAQRVRQH
jgi:hypothetical protein